MSKLTVSRRTFLAGLGVAAATTWRKPALAAEEPTSVVLVYFIGGYNAIFGSAASLQGSFGITQDNMTSFGGNVSFDNVLAESFNTYARAHTAVIGVNHGLSSHPGARRALWSENEKNAGHILAGAIGGSSPKKALIAGANDVDQNERPREPVGDISFESERDMQAYLDGIGAGKPGPRDPSREKALAGIGAAQAMTARELGASPKALTPLAHGYRTALDALKNPTDTFDLPGLQTAYGITGSKIGSFASKMAAAELFVKTGANVVTVFDGGWDTHGDTDGRRVRNQMAANAPALKTFLTRMVTPDSGRNVVVCLLGDFARDLPGSDHQPNLSATVVGKYVKPGSTGKVNAKVGLATNTPGVRGLWSYLAAAAKVSQNPFGQNPHGLVA